VNWYQPNQAPEAGPPAIDTEPNGAATAEASFNHNIEDAPNPPIKHQDIDDKAQVHEDIILQLQYESGRKKRPQ
jgi:hypothetical protein